MPVWIASRKPSIMCLPRRRSWKQVFFAFRTLTRNSPPHNGFFVSYSCAEPRRCPSVAVGGAQRMSAEQKLGEILLRLKALNRIDRDRVLETLRRSGRKQKFGQVARAMGLVGEEHILAALAVQMNLFPGVEWMTLEQILEYLQTAEIC